MSAGGQQYLILMVDGGDILACRGGGLRGGELCQTETEIRDDCRSNEDDLHGMDTASGGKVMLRIVDMRSATSEDQGFAVWDTVRSEFLSHNGDFTWDGEADFRKSINDDWDATIVERICSILPGWAKDCDHTETEASFMGGSEYMTTCKRCGKVLSE